MINGIGVVNNCYILFKISQEGLFFPSNMQNFSGFNKESYVNF